MLCNCSEPFFFFFFLVKTKPNKLNYITELKLQWINFSFLLFLLVTEITIASPDISSSMHLKYITLGR